MKIFRYILLALSCLTNASIFANTVTNVTAAAGEWDPYVGEKLRNGGILTDITLSALSNAGVTVDLDYMPWNRALELTKTAKLDMTYGWRKSEEREKLFLLSDPIINETIHFFHLKSMDFEWSKMTDVAHYNIGTVRSYFYGKEFEKEENNGRLKIQKSMGEISNFKKLLRKRIDIVPVSTFVGKNILRANFLDWEANAITFYPKPVSTSTLHVFVSKSNPNGQEIINAFNEGLKKLKASGKYQKILDKLLTQ